jgi:hemerythrin-like domain-containing protein
MAETIRELMVREHLAIENFLKELDSQRENLSRTMEILSRLKWTLEKHFIMEEKAIFEILNGLKGVEIDETFELLRDHQQILELINNIEEGFENGSEVNLQRVKEMLEKHLEMEGIFFYPKLDNVLEERDKKEILDKAREIIRG